MAEQIIKSAGTKDEKYSALLPQLRALLSGEPDLVACMANVAAALKTAMGFFWVGFYIVRGEELVLGPFQGPVACTRIQKGRGVCGSSWLSEKTIVVDDVDKFPGHIACSSESKSEIVVPLWSGGKVLGVLDVDSDQLSSFDESDRAHLETICALLENKRLN